MSEGNPESIRSMTSAPREHDVFISYASEDKETADLVCAALEQAGIPCWIAPRDTQAGAYGRSIMAAIRSARMLVLVLSPDADRSPNVLTEVAEAFDRKIPLLPFRLSNFVVSDELRFYIRTQHWIDAFPDPPQGHVRQLVKQVRTRMAARVRAPSREPDRSPEAPQDAPPPRPPARARPARARRWTVPLIVGGAAFVVIGIAVAVALLQPGPTPGPPARAADGPGISPAPPPVPPPAADRDADAASGRVGDCWGALGAGPDGAQSMALNYPTRDAAQRAAQARCGPRCSLISFHNSCGANATGSNGWGWGYGGTREAAESMAMSRCRENTRNCAVRVWGCTLR